MIAFNRTRGQAIASRVEKAEDYDSRARGLLGRKTMAADEGLWIVPCPMIHTLFMRFPIDVIFLDRESRVVRVVENLKPWRMSPWVFRARSVLELAGGTLKGSVRPGDCLEIK
ncbi:MAG TPA: DUF192 domain-containing protein [Elusimicrobia bacterium]|nr:DUF192 domain-containing protein [Elusimicrobiota bacterium]HBT61971.1 DUF192 domain-containing protein [Elusimicrobiota bacterium]